MGRHSAAITTTLVITIAAAAACGGAREIEVRHAAVPEVDDSVYVQVSNDQFYDARVYVLYEGGARYSLGLITGHMKSAVTPVLWQPRPMLFEISFIAREGLYYSEEVVVDPGDMVFVSIPPNIGSSAF
ncbi:MAG: hypothetical protein OER90_09745, partial [Gemmatimonadota bacterium]|nr:hypothetical protein [Gemmatimonadota bacterium]